jgi:hypothetical protein
MRGIECFKCSTCVSARSRERGDILMNWPGADVLEWFEKHAGLGGWVGAVGALLAIIVTWRLARAEYLRAQRLNKECVNEVIALFERITLEFNPIVVRYVELLQNNDPATATYRPEWEENPLWDRAVDLYRMPITQWPSVESYDAYRRYFLAASRALQSDINYSRDVIARNIDRFSGTYETLQTALKLARAIHLKATKPS